MQLHTIGIDLGKTLFHLVGFNQRGEVVVRKKFSRKQLLHFTANLQVKLIGMEACGGSHFLGRALREQGHEVRLMPAQYVKPYVHSRFPHLQTSGDYGVDDFLPGLLANYAMTQRSNPALSKPVNRKGLPRLHY
jgi:hypothetical protein